MIVEQSVAQRRGKPRARTQTFCRNMNLLHILGLASLLGIVSCGDLDVVSRHYATLEDAQEDIEKGWIPATLPKSAYDIHDSHDLDLNVGECTFKFDKELLWVYMNGLFQHIPENARGLPDDEELARLEREGYLMKGYSSGDTFYLVGLHREGKGRYWMALQYD
jgi:hypothetical protein